MCCFTVLLSFQWHPIIDSNDNSLASFVCNTRNFSILLSNSLCSIYHYNDNISSLNCGNCTYNTVSLYILFILFLRLRPAVSINIYSLPSYFMAVSIASLVVPAISDTITLSSRASLLISDDLPTLGLPTIATLGLSSSSSCLDESGNALQPHQAYLRVRASKLQI